jgi:DNA-binding NtrC family response regulator
LSIAFTNKGCFLETAENAEEGLQALKKERFDIIISDLRLPGKDGLEFLKLARNSQPDTLCVLITAYRDKLISSEVSAMGINDFIEKPFSIGALIESLVSLITSRGNN